MASTRRAKNTNRQGAAFELRIMADLARHGYVAHRSSGSHGAVDVVAVGDTSTLWIQAKISQQTIPPAERAAVLALVDRVGLSATPMSAYRVPGGVGYRVLTGPGPKDFLPWEPSPLRFAPCTNVDCDPEHRLSAHTGLGCWSRDGTCPCTAFVLGT